MTELPDHDELAGAYVLGTLPAARRRQVEQAQLTDGRLRAAVEYWEQRLLPLTSIPEPVTPSTALWERIEHSVLPARTPGWTGAVQASWWNRLNVWRGLAAGGFAAAAIMAFNMGETMRPSPGTRFVTVLAAPQSMAPGWVIKMPDARTLLLEPLGDTTVPEQRVLQLWTKADGWKGPVSLGFVTPGRKLEVRLDKLPPVQPNQLFEITLEPAGGSPLGRPTGPILYIGRSVKMT
ncbi:anti-sigma factor [Massilia sp. SYSU DXS3249]